MRRMGSPSAQEYASGGGDDIGSQAQIRLQRARIIALEGELATSAEESAERAAALLTAEFEVKELLAEKLAMQKALAVMVEGRRSREADVLEMLGTARAVW